MADVSKVKLNGTAYNVKDASVPSWAKQSSKPSYTQDEVGDGSTYKRVTSTEKSTWNNKGTYSKPSGGIPKSDLASAVQTSLGKADTALQSFTESDPTVPSWAKQSSKPSYTASEVGAIATSAKGAANGVASLDSAGKVPSSQLPSYVDDVLEYSAKSSFPSTGETGKIYVDTSTNKTYRWSGSAYVEISASLALGETSSTAYAGDKGKTAYTHATETRLTTATASGLYKVASTAQGHIASLTAVAKDDITALGIPGTDTTYSSKSAASGGTDVSLVTTGEKYTWNNKGTYSKPSGGIPKSDLASAVQTSLGKADTALQSFTETDPTVPSWAKQSSKPSYTYSEVGAAPASHSHYQLSTIGDYRAVATKPDDYPNIAQFKGLKQNSVIGSPSSDTYSYIVGLRGWSDNSCGNAHEFAFNDTGIFTRRGASTSWGSWAKLAMTSDIPSSLPASDVYSWAKQSSKPSYTQDEVSDGSTYKRVSATEKNTWNSKGTYSKPSGGIPKSDLASAVQTSLGKADTALQSSTDITNALGYTPANNDGVNQALNVRVRCDQYAGTGGSSQTFRVFKTSERGVVLVVCGAQAGLGKQSTILVFDIQQGIQGVRRLAMGGNNEVVDGVTINAGSGYDDAVITYTVQNTYWPPVIIPLMPNDKTPQMYII